MNLYLENIGKIKNANIRIDGITVIAGENNTGKSTIGKSLYAVFNSFYEIEKKIKIERKNSVKKIFEKYRILFKHDYHYGLYDQVIDDISSRIVSNRIGILENRINLIDFLKRLINTNKNFIIENDYIDIGELEKNVKEVLNVSEYDLLKLVLEKNLNSEFDGQINNVFSDEQGTISLSINDNKISVVVENNEIVKVINEENILINTPAIYIDDPFILDSLPIRYPSKYLNTFLNHRNMLRKMLSSDNRLNTLVDEIIVKDKLQDIYSKINSVCSGEIICDGNLNYIYQSKKTDKGLNVTNLSTGLKTFAILKMLLEKGIIEQNGTIILDEPEIHLHPEWQLIFAEIIVLIQKNFGIHILLNTHSPYFLNAIETYSVKYGIDYKCKYYLSNAKENFSELEDVTDNIEKIYEKLAKPLQTLENEV